MMHANKVTESPIYFHFYSRRYTFRFGDIFIPVGFYSSLMAGLWLQLIRHFDGLICHLQHLLLGPSFSFCFLYLCFSPSASLSVGSVSLACASLSPSTVHPLG